MKGKINNHNNHILNPTMAGLVILLLLQDMRNQKISISADEREKIMKDNGSKILLKMWNVGIIRCEKGKYKHPGDYG